MAKKKSQTGGELSASEGSETEEIAFEAAMEELAAIVAKLESGRETLDESLKQFERGMALLRTCHQRLDGAAQQIELVTRLTETGEVTTEPFDSTATHNTQSATGSRSRNRNGSSMDDDNVRLF